MLNRHFFLPMFLLAVCGCSASAQVTVVSAAGYQTVVAPDSLASIFGSGLSNSTASAELDPSGQLPTELAGVCVTINGIASPMLYVSPEQINIVVPSTVGLGTAAVVVQSSGTQFTGSVEIRNVAPALFALDASGKGPGAVLNAVTFSGGPFLVETPGNPGDDKRTRLAVYATGLRYAGNPARDPAKPNAAIQLQATDSLGNVYKVEYAGAAPGFFGLDQINLIIPAAADGAGKITLTIAADGVVSNTVTFEMGSVPASAVHFTDLALSRTTLTGGTDFTVTVALNAIARSPGYQVALTANSLVVQIPTLFVVPQGQASAALTVHTSANGTTNAVTVAASGGGVTKSANISVVAANAAKVNAVGVSSGDVQGGGSVTGTVTLNAAAPVEGVVVQLAGDNKAVVVPASVALSFGQTSRTFTVATSPVITSQQTVITASYGNSNSTAKLSVNPPLTLTLAQPSVVGGGSVAATIKLTQAAPSGGAVVALQTSDAALAPVPENVKLPAGSTSATFTVATTAVTSSQKVVITATYSGIAESVTLGVSPANLPALSNWTVNPGSIAGGNSVTGTITISGPAPSPGLAVDLTTDLPFAASIPAVAVVPPGQTTYSFMIPTVKAASSQDVNITASAGNVSKTATLTIQ